MTESERGCYTSSASPRGVLYHLRSRYSETGRRTKRKGRPLSPYDFPWHTGDAEERGFDADTTTQSRIPLSRRIGVINIPAA